MPKSPPPHPELILAQRFFARNRTFDTECPHCGLVYRVRLDSNPTIWNPRNGTFACMDMHGCRREYIAGLLLWPKGRGKNTGMPPADQVPGPRQLAQLDPRGSGWWLPDEYKHKGRPDPTNLTGEIDRPPEEDATDLQLAISDVEEAPRCLQCYQPYSFNKSTAKNTQQYCCAACEEAAP